MQPLCLKSVVQETIFTVTGTMPDKGADFTMANWSDPRPRATSFGTTATGQRTEAYDAGLRSYMLSVYNYMGSAVLLTGIVAMLFAWGGAESPAAQVFMSGGILKYVIMFSPLAIVMVRRGGVKKKFSAKPLTNEHAIAGHRPPTIAEPTTSAMNSIASVGRPWKSGVTSSRAARTNGPSVPIA